jgi:UDP-N-acetylglucosamine 4,6-dehydratase
VYSGGHETKFGVVRYGNVLGSRGSVVPFFKERLKTGVLPITDKEMTRFWITLDQAAHFVLMAMAYCKGGEVFVPKIPSMEIVDLAKAIAPACKQEIVGVRPGEKIHETLISQEEARNTLEFKHCYIVYPYVPLEKKQNGPKKGSGKPCHRDFEYISNNNTQWLSVEELRKLVEQISDDYSIEQSRWSMEDVPQ